MRATVSDFQTILARDILANAKFEFIPTPSPYVKQGVMYKLSEDFKIDHTYCGLQVNRFRFFDRDNYQNQQLQAQLTTKGYAEIANGKVKDVLRSKIITALKDVTGRTDIFHPDCDIVLRLCWVKSCFGLAQERYPHYACVKARKAFESYENVKITSKRGEMPCLIYNKVHPFEDYKNLHVSFFRHPTTGLVYDSIVDYDSFDYNDQHNKYNTPSPSSSYSTPPHPSSTNRDNEDFYLSYSSELNGVIDVKITGIHIKDIDAQADTIRVWAFLLESNLLTPFSEEFEYDEGDNNNHTEFGEGDDLRDSTGLGNFKNTKSVLKVKSVRGVREVVEDRQDREDREDQQDRQDREYRGSREGPRVERVDDMRRRKSKSYYTY